MGAAGRPSSRPPDDVAAMAPRRRSDSVTEQKNIPKMILVDTHTHPFDEVFDADREEVMTRAQEAGLAKLLCPAIDSETHERLFALCDRYPDRCLPMMGLHPTSVNDNPRWREELETVERLLAAGERRYWAVGEVGLDFYWSRDWLAEQVEAFERQAELALRYDLPLVIHTRDAWPEMIASLRRFAGRGLRGVMHAFSGTWDDYCAVLACGDFLFGIGGVVTYKKSPLPELLQRIPAERIVLETDAPYLPPVPYRGKRNEPAYIVRVCERVAEATGRTPEEVAVTTTANAARMFGFAVE